MEQVEKKSITTTSLIELKCIANSHLVNCHCDLLVDQI